MKPALAALPVILALACTEHVPGPVTQVTVQLVAGDPDPFAGVAHLRMIVHPPGAQPADPIELTRGGQASLAALPLEDGYRVVIEGRGSTENLVAVGRTAPITLASASAISLSLLFGKTDRFTAVPNAIAERFGHTATPLNDGRVLLLGGIIGDTAATPATLEGRPQLFDPAKVAVSTSPGTFQRFGHTATPLSDGRILLAGGSDASRTPVAKLEQLDVTAATGPVALPDLHEVRADHSASLANGQLFLAGGRGADGQLLDSTVLYDPSANRFVTDPPRLSLARADHTATVLGDGTVLLLGGTGPSGPLDSADLYTPGQGVSALASHMLTPRIGHTATRLPSGHVIIAGGTDGAQTLRSLEAFDEATKTFARVTDAGGQDLLMITGRAGHAAAALGGSRVLIAGGGDATIATNGAFLFVADDLAETTSRFEGSLAQLTSFASARSGAALVTTPDGNGILLGGAAPDGGTTSTVPSIEVFIPSTVAD